MAKTERGHNQDMDEETIQALIEVNNDFYREQAGSFSNTRQAPWPGWEKCLAVLEAGGFAGGLGSGGSAVGLEAGGSAGGLEGGGSVGGGLSVFDLACGNLRFAAFLAAALPEAELTVYAVDNCPELVASAKEAAALKNVRVRFQSLDVLGALLDGVGDEAGGTVGAGGLAGAGEMAGLGGRFLAPPCDIAVAFGFLHHIPTQKLRQATLRSLLGQVRPSGWAVVSLWQFLTEPGLRQKAEAMQEQALVELGLPELEEGDFLLGWQDVPGAWRYCHSFSEAEIDGLADSVAGQARLLARFAADGRNGALNSYLVWQRI